MQAAAQTGLDFNKATRWSLENLKHIRETRRARRLGLPIEPAKTIKEYDVPGAQFNPTELVLDAGLDKNDWAKVGSALARVHQASQFWIGDWIEYGRRLYGIETSYDLAVQVTGISRGTLTEYARLSRRYPSSERVAAISFHHHKALLPFLQATRAKLLAEAAEFGLTVKQTKELAIEECGKPKPRPYKGRRPVWSSCGRKLSRALMACAAKKICRFSSRTSLRSGCNGRV